MSTLLPKHNWSRIIIAFCFIIILILENLNYFAPIKEFLYELNLEIKFGKYSIAITEIIEALAMIIVIGWFASTCSAITTKGIRNIKSLNHSNRTLLSKIFQIIIYTIFIIIGMNSLSIDITTFTVFSGALGIGLGFGLQKITSNFISGVILLVEKSVEKGDLIELHDGTYGFIRKTTARYTLLETLDTKEIMIPNEDFITNRVINWTFSTNKGRIEIPVGVSYDSDMERVREILISAAQEYSDTLPQPAPRCYMREYADSSVNFLLHFWVDNIEQEPLKPQSDVMHIIWRKFKENNISIPYPQRDIHVIKGKED